MRIDILTLFPDTLLDVLSDSILGRAQERGIITIDAHQIYVGIIIVCDYLYVSEFSDLFHVIQIQNMVDS